MRISYWSSDVCSSDLVPDDYIALHQWFDESKKIIADPRHRALRHHAEGIFLLETLIGVTIRNSDGRKVPVRLLGEAHLTEDLGSISEEESGVGTECVSPCRSWWSPLHYKKKTK